MSRPEHRFRPLRCLTIAEPWPHPGPWPGKHLSPIRARPSAPQSFRKRFHRCHAGSPTICTSVSSSIPRFDRAAVLDLLDQFQNLGCRRPAIVHNKIAVHLGNTGLADPAVLQTQLVHQFSRRAGFGILENAPRAFCNRLGGPAFFLRSFQPPGNLFLGRGRSPKYRGNGEIILQ